MKRFLRDVLVGFLASFLAAVAVHLLNFSTPRPGRGAIYRGAKTVIQRVVGDVPHWGRDSYSLPLLFIHSSAEMQVHLTPAPCPQKVKAADERHIY